MQGTWRTLPSLERRRLSHRACQNQDPVFRIFATIIVPAKHFLDSSGCREHGAVCRRPGTPWLQYLHGLLPWIRKLCKSPTKCMPSLFRLTLALAHLLASVFQEDATRVDPVPGAGCARHSTGNA